MYETARIHNERSHVERALKSVCCLTPGVIPIAGTESNRLIRTGGAIAAAAAISLGAAGSVSTASSAVAAPVASSTSIASTATPTSARIQAKQAIRAKYGIYPLPIRERQIKRFHLSKKVLREVAAAKRFANTPKAKAVRWCESNGIYTLADGNYHGAWQFDRGTWLSNGGGKYGSTANKAPRWAQDLILYKTWQVRGWQPWSCA